MEKEPLLSVRYDKSNEKVHEAMRDIEAHRTAEVVNGTLEKSGAIEYLLREAGAIVREYFDEQGFDAPFDEDAVLDRTYVFDEDEVHLRTREGADIKFVVHAASYDAIADKLYLKGGERGLEAEGEIFALRVLVHEMVHMCQRMYLRAHESVSGKVHVQKRGGYHLDTRVHDNGEVLTDRSGKLGGLNEAFTDMVAVRAIESAEILHPASLTRLWHDSYPEEKRAFVAILDRIAEVEEKPHEEVEREFLEGYVLGNMMHLRRIERYFGKDALKVFALLGTFRLEDPESRNWNNMIARFFETEDEEERAEIAQILFENENKRGSEGDVPPEPGQI